MHVANCPKSTPEKLQAGEFQIGYYRQLQEVYQCKPMLYNDLPLTCDRIRIHL